VTSAFTLRVVSHLPKGTECALEIAAPCEDFLKTVDFFFEGCGLPSPSRK